MNAMHWWAGASFNGRRSEAPKEEPRAPARCSECGSEAAQAQTEAEHAYALLEVAEAKLEYVLAENARLRSGVVTG